ncbi:MAG TPA: Uma2 family endonuclease [Thermoanaerobaculia bacterium]|nr:Uma2 family endonuclease [Thermoanaerobaculia bacterium]
MIPLVGLGPYRASDYATLPDEPRCELIYGRIFVTPSPAPPHQMAGFLVAKRLDRIAERVNGQVFVAPLDVWLAEHSVVQPDVIYISAAHRSIVGERIEGAPDLLVEVLSPRTSRRDRNEKLALYAEAGVGEYWLLDLAARQVTFLVNEGGRFVVVIPEGATYRSPKFPEIEFDVEGFWQEFDRRSK